MFNPLGYEPSILELIPWAIGIAGLVVGFLWIKRIVDNIEDN